MTTEFKLPELGEGIESGDVTNVPVKVGDTVRKNQTLLEIEAGKATMEIPSPTEGTLTALHVKTGDTVQSGQLVAEIEATSSTSEDGGQRSEGGGQKAEGGGQKAEGGERTEKEEVAPVAEPIAEKPESIPVKETQPVELHPPTSEAAKPTFPAVSAAPNVRKLARELGVTVHEVPASAPDGHISEEDVKAFARERLLNGCASAPRSTEPSERIEKMSAVRKATMKHMAHCWAMIPHVTLHDTADITRLEELRKRFAPQAEAAGAKLTMTAVLVKIISSALKAHPEFNCSIDPEKAEIIYKEYYNIGIAMDTPKGLLVPVIQNGDRKNMVELALELHALTERARAGKLTAEDLTGGTFTFTNIGIIGGSFFTPIVNSPEVAILGAGRAHWVAGVEGRTKRFRLPLSLSIDHRIIDGAAGARFLRWVIDAIEEPLLISLQG